MTQRLLSALVFVALFRLTPMSAQNFNSGSDGSDGPLSLLSGSGTVLFDPFDTTRWGKVLDADGDGVYNFTTISIAAGTTLKLTGDKVNRPVYWLASGNVMIDGTIDVSGAPAVYPVTSLDQRRRVAIPGSGGFAGGAAGRSSEPVVAATPGEGPGGGIGLVEDGFGPGCTGGYTCAKGGMFTGNLFLLPLVGGSGGAGATSGGGGVPGGAGGGAILIASSTSITMNGQITTAGGFGHNAGGSGSGGAIRMVAPIVAGSGIFTVAGGGAGQTAGGRGLVRLEGNQIGTAFTIAPATAVVRSTFGHPSTLRPTSEIRVTAVDGIPLGPNPSGTFQVPAVVIQKAQAVNVAIEASGVPPGTAVTLQVYPDVPLDPTAIYLPTATATLEGTVQSTTATITLAFPRGFSRGSVRASW